MLYMKSQQKLGEEGPDLLPDLIPSDFDTSAAAKFRADLGLKECGDEDSLVDRTWRLKEALKAEGMINPELDQASRQKLLQLLLEYADVFCIDKRDLRRPAKAEAMKLDTKGHPPIK